MPVDALLSLGVHVHRVDRLVVDDAGAVGGLELAGGSGATFFSSVTTSSPDLPVRTTGVETNRFKAFTYDELIARDKVNLDLIWLKDDSLEDLDNLPSPEIIAR